MTVSSLHGASAPRRSATARAYGKINLHLGVGDAGPDGYHELVTVFQALGCAETVTLALADSGAAADSGPAGGGTAWPGSADGADAPAGTDSVIVTGRYADADIPLDSSNLALAAVEAFRAHTGWDRRVAITIDKQVPVAGGMGGGSADAAAALRAAAALAGFTDKAALHRIAATLGADVPFALRGGIALGRGRGDELTSVLSQGTQHWVLATSTGTLSTPAVYQRLDELRAGTHVPQPAPASAAGPGAVEAAPRASSPSPSWGTEIRSTSWDARLDEPTAVLAALASGSVEELAEAVHNDMTAAAVSLLPDIAHVMEAGRRAGALAVLLSGSGPTVGFLAQDSTHALELAVLLEATRGVRHVVRTTGPARGAHLVE